ncbi:MAG: hypothetical protein R3B48_10285 [Kofleriaceae bacterium]
MNDWQRLDELLERGLDFYGRQLVAEAIECWREVLYLSPGHNRALEYLEAAGASPTLEPPAPPSPDARGPGGSAPRVEPPRTLESLSALTVELIRERRFEEALALLYTARAEAPKDQSISRSINVIKQRLTREYRAELGSPSQIPTRILDDAVVEELGLSEDEHEVLRLVDGIVALEDIMQSSGLGTLQIYRVLVELLRRGVIRLNAPDGGSERRQERAPAREVGPSKPAPFRPKLVPPESSATPAPLRLVSLPPVPPPPGAPSAPLEMEESDASRSIGSPRRPSPYAAHVAEAVRAHLQGKQARARELLELCAKECPDDPAAKRNLDKLRERLGFKEER